MYHCWFSPSSQALIVKMSTAYTAKYFAFELTKRCASDNMEKLAACLADAQISLNQSGRGGS
jgi:hypothetical protein